MGLEHTDPYTAQSVPPAALWGKRGLFLLCRPAYSMSAHSSACAPLHSHPKHWEDSVTSHPLLLPRCPDLHGHVLDHTPASHISFSLKVPPPSPAQSFLGGGAGTAPDDPLRVSCDKAVTASGGKGKYKAPKEFEAGAVRARSLVKVYCGILVLKNRTELATS